MFGTKSPVMIAPEQALPGRQTPLPTDAFHAVLKTPLKGPYPEGAHTAIFGMGCFWGVERLFWRLSGVFVTAAGYAGGYTPNPTYEEVCSGLTGHTEVVLVVFDPLVITYKDLLKTFWENHDPTQGMRQGGDIGTQYRSALYTTTEAQAAAAEDSKRAYAAALAGKGYGEVTTEIAPAPPFYFAEGYHQGYLQKNPGGYCGLKGSGVVCIL